MTLKVRPNIYQTGLPTPTVFSRSNGTTGVVQHGNKIGTLADEVSVGTHRRKPPAGWIDPTPYVLTRLDRRAAIGTCNNMPSGFPSTNGQKWVGVVGVLPGDSVTRFNLDNALNPVLLEATAKADDGLRNAALIAARNKLKTASVDLGVAFAERKQTAGLIAGTATRIANSFTHLKRGSVRKAMDELGISSKRRQPRGSNVPNKWLEMQYGWKPLLSDVYGSADSLARRNRDDWRVTAKATRKLALSYGAEYDPGNPGWGVVTVDVKKSVFVRIDCVPSNEVLISLSSMGVLNPLMVVWERMPWSFVVDWFIPIGSYIDSLDATWGYQCRGFSSSLLVKAAWNITGKSGNSITAPGKISNSYAGGKDMVYVNREVSVSVPIPSLPGFKDPRSLTHMANALALLTSAFGRR